MVKLLQETYPSYKVLTVLHEGRIRSKKVQSRSQASGVNSTLPRNALLSAQYSSPAQISEAGKTFLADCRKNQTLFATPTGSNDDWCAGLRRLL